MTLLPTASASVRAAARMAMVAVVTGLSACAAPPQRSSSDVAAVAACRQRADEVYAKQNRAEVYNTDTFASSGRDSPFSNSDLPDVPTRGLSGQYQRDTMISDCLAGTGAATGPSTSAAPAPSARPPAAGTP